MAARTTEKPRGGVFPSAGSSTARSAFGRARTATFPANTRNRKVGGGGGGAARPHAPTAAPKSTPRPAAKAKAKASARPLIAPPSVADRALGLCVLFSLAFVGLAGRLLYLQVGKHKELVQDAQELRSKAVRLPARRGELLDRDGNLLVRNEPACAVALDPNIWYEDPNPKAGDTPEARQRRAIDGLSKILTDVDVQAVVAEKGVEKGKSGRYRTIDIAPIIPVGVGELIKKENLPGVSVQPTAKRVALDGELASHVLGYTRKDGVGAAGVEYALDSALTGAPGVVEGEFDPRGRPIPGTVRREQPAQNGQDVVLTLDSDLQHIVQEALGKAFLSSKAEAATAVVLDPHNGDILALANYPNFDVNTRSGLTKGAGTNRAVNAPFEPGSTMKAFTIAAGLEDHKFTPESRFFCTGERQIGKRKIHCHNGEKHGDEDLTGVVKNSCNVATAQCAFEVGKTRLYEYLHLFGFGERCNSGLPGETRGILASPERWSDIQLSNIAFGQGVSVTALQLAAAYGAIANDGVYMRPRIVRGVRTDGGQIQENKPEAVRRVLSANTARTLRKMLKAVVDEGTGTAARLNGYAAGGKTGTAQIAEHGRYGGKHLASFIGIAPLDNPRYVILVSITDPKGDYYGGSVSGPVFKEIAEKALTLARVPRDPNAVIAKKGAAGGGTGKPRVRD